MAAQSTPLRTKDTFADDDSLCTPNLIPISSLKQSQSIDRDLCTPSKTRRSLIDTPRTPTPFKKALAELEKKSGAVKYLVIIFILIIQNVLFDLASL